MESLALWDPEVPTTPLLIFDGAPHAPLLPAIARVAAGGENTMYKKRPIFHRDARSSAIAEDVLRVIGRFLPSISRASSADDSDEVRGNKDLLLHPVVHADDRFSAEVDASRAACMLVDPAYARSNTMFCPWVKTKGYATLFLGMDQEGVLIFCGMHQLVMWALHGPPPASTPLCLHRCDRQKHCVNPLHLYYGTAADNARDREAAARQRAVASLTATMAGLNVVNKQRKEAAAPKCEAGEWAPSPALPIPSAKAWWGQPVLHNRFRTDCGTGRVRGAPDPHGQSSRGLLPEHGRLHVHLWSH